MSWTYLGVPGTGSVQGRRDAVRLLVKDTVSTRQLIQDEELDFFLSENSDSIWGAAADACDQIAAREAKSKSVGDLSLSGLGENYKELGRTYRMRLGAKLVPFAGGISVADKDSRAQDTDVVQPTFTRTLHQTPGVSVPETSS